MEQKRPAARVQQGFLHGAFILMFGVLLVKAIGALFKIPLSSIITEDGMGYFSTAYSFFNVLFSLSTVGFPVAVARLTAAEDALGHFRDVRQIKAAALPVFSVIGVLCALLMASFAPLYTRLVQSPGALFSMLALAPCAALCSISSVYRGYFEGLRNMLPTARSQVAESLGKLIFGLSGAIFVMHMGTRELQASGTVFGCTVKSEADGCQLVCALGAAAAILGVTLGAVSLMLCLWGALVLSRQVTRPVREMTAAMKRVQLGELSARVVPRGEGELGQLAVGFNQMVAECELNLRRSVERQKELNDTRIRMMQSQLNPHFLYNTLDSMKWMGVTHGVPQVATLAEDLAKILRASISGDEFVTLGQELELLERYIDIQLIRFEDRFACEIEVDDALMGCMVPKLVLQPIVENAVIHGVRDMDDGYIKIWAEADAGDLRLFVQDNGCGMEKPQDGPLGFGVSGRPGEHLGMFNVDSILRLHFGDAYGLSVRSRPGEGCLVMVRLPMRREKA